MKSNFKPFLLLIAFVALVWAGCQTQYPTNYSVAGTNAAAMVVNFEGGSPLLVSPILAEANRPGNQVIAAGAVGVVGATGVVLNSALVSPGAANTNQCYHIWGTVTDPGNATYPSIQMQIPLEKSASVTAFYDASFFTGVKFYIKVPGSDTAGKRTFSIPIDQTQPTANGGDCDKPPYTPPPSSNNPCYNDFNVAYTTTNGAWQPEILPFSSFTRGAYGAPVTPTTLSGANLQHIIMLDWTEGNSNVAGTVKVDFTVDEVQFF